MKPLLITRKGTVSNEWDVSVLCFVHDKSMCYILFLSEYLGICLQPKPKKKTNCDFYLLQYIWNFKGYFGAQN